MGETDPATFPCKIQNKDFRKYLSTPGVAFIIKNEKKVPVNRFKFKTLIYFYDYINFKMYVKFSQAIKYCVNSLRRLIKKTTEETYVNFVDTTNILTWSNMILTKITQKILYRYISFLIFYGHQRHSGGFLPVKLVKTVT